MIYYKQIIQTYLEPALRQKTFMTHPTIDPFQDTICISFVFSKKFASIASHRKQIEDFNFATEALKKTFVHK